MITRFCQDCNQQSDDTTWSDHFRTRLCMDCYNFRCERGQSIVVHCERCGGDGGWSVERTFDPFTGNIGYDDIRCDACGGKGEYEVEFEPIEMEDLDIIGGDDV